MDQAKPSEEIKNQTVPIRMDVLEQLQSLADIGLRTASYAHEINNALTPLRGFAHLARKLSQDPEAANRAIDQLAASIEEVNEMTRLILGSVSAADTEYNTNIHTEVDRCVRISGSSTEGVTSRNRVPPDLNVRIAKTSLQIILRNLLTNALRAVSGGGIINFDASVEKDIVYLVVSDDGPGIPDDVKTALQQPISLCPTDGGHGIGLVVSRRLAEQVGGTLRILPSDSGARVEVRLPRAVPGDSSHTLD